MTVVTLAAAAAPSRTWKHSSRARDRVARTCNTMASAPKHSSRARDRVAAFGPGLDFDAPLWDVTSSHVSRDSSTHQTARLYFTTHEGGNFQGYGWAQTAQRTVRGLR